MKTYLVSLLFVLVASVASAQIGTPTSTLVFDQVAPDLATAQGYTYRLYADGATTSTVVLVTCAGTSALTCTLPFPAFTPGTHTIQLSASNTAGEGPKSALFTFTFVVVPAAPQNIRIGGA